MPSEGLGANPHNPDDVGWRAGWNVHLPATPEDLIAQITSPDCTEPHTWTEADVGAEDKPINCVSWYVAHAFCIWDGGRLPTQAEWNYAASGGDEQRLYPWSVPRDSSMLDEAHAVYNQDGPLAVGQRSSGVGRWKQHDLAGNLWEWVFDDHERCYATPDRCDNCGIATATPIYKTSRGGGYFDSSDDVTSAARNYTEGEFGYSDYGFRCARDL
jgi:formylglycine-generating enzyme required for sulfatase activity